MEGNGVIEIHRVGRDSKMYILEREVVIHTGDGLVIAEGKMASGGQVIHLDPDQYVGLKKSGLRLKDLNTSQR